MSRRNPDRFHSSYYNRLKPCPFCGERPKVEPWHGGPKTKRLISCDNDDCAVSPGVTGDTARVAVIRWNTRQAASSQETTVAALWAFAEAIGAPLANEHDAVDPNRLGAVGVAMERILRGFGFDVTPVE